MGEFEKKAHGAICYAAPELAAGKLSAYAKEADARIAEQQKAIDSLGAALNKAMDIISESNEINYLWVLSEIEDALKAFDMAKSIFGENNG